MIITDVANKQVLMKSQHGCSKYNPSFQVQSSTLLNLKNKPPYDLSIKCNGGDNIFDKNKEAFSAGSGH